MRKADDIAGMYLGGDAARDDLKNHILEYGEAMVLAERERIAARVDDLRQVWFHEGIPGDTAVPAGAFARSMKQLAAAIRAGGDISTHQ